LNNTSPATIDSDKSRNVLSNQKSIQKNDQDESHEVLTDPHYDQKVKEELEHSKKQLGLM
jgi:hypothetical protein